MILIRIAAMEIMMSARIPGRERLGCQWRPWKSVSGGLGLLFGSHGENHVKSRKGNLTVIFAAKFRERQTNTGKVY